MSSLSRKPMRLEGFDYRTEGAYYITICTKNKAKILCEIDTPKQTGEAPVIKMSPFGSIVEELIQKIPGLDKYVIMPNHVHLIIRNSDQIDISAKIRYFKINTTRKAGKPIWQRSFYDHVIRDETDYLIKWNYIDGNPAKWASDDCY